MNEFLSSRANGKVGFPADALHPRRVTIILRDINAKRPRVNYQPDVITIARSGYAQLAYFIGSARTRTRT